MMEPLLGSYLAAVLAGDRREAFRLVDEARAGGMDMRTLYEDLFVPAQRDIGRLWQENRITVADEHLATSITQSAMARLYDVLFDTQRREGWTLVAACTDIERHELGLRMMCDLLELEGWDTIYLGATVPLESLVNIVRERRPRAVALSTALPSHLPRLRETISELRAAFGDAAPLILVGGRPFLDDPGLARRIGADLTAPTAAEAARKLSGMAA